MPTPEDDLQPSPKFARDIEIFDAEPWTGHGPIDDLIDLQQQAFRADRVGNYQQFGTVLMSMSQIEHAIDNHGEAAAYASNAAEAFEKAGNSGDATAAHATVAREYRTLRSPSLAIASLQEVIAYTSGKAGTVPTETDPPRLDANALPTIRLLANFASTFSGVIHEDGVDYPPVIYHKYPKLSGDTASEFLYSLDQFLEMPLNMSGGEALTVFLRLSSVYFLISQRRFGLRGMDKTEAKFMATALAKLSWRIGMGPNSSRVADLASGSQETVNSIVSAHNLRDLDFL